MPKDVNASLDAPNAAQGQAGAPDPARFLSLQKAMLDATPDCIKIISPGGRVLTMNRAGCLALNVPLDSAFGMPWLPLLPPSVHEEGVKALARAAAGETARFAGKSQSPGGMMYWDNMLNPILDEAGRVQQILVISRDVTEQTRLDLEIQAGANREKLLRWEMQHRVKNLFAVVSGLLSISEVEAHRSETDEACAMQILREKLGALSRASDAALPAGEAVGDHGSQLDLRAIIAAVLAPHGPRCRLAGEASSVRREAVTNLALLLHEFATNSVKNGALGPEEGAVEISWQTSGDELTLTWAEQGGPAIEAAPEQQGFGSEMVQRLVESVGGRIEKNWPRTGLRAEVFVPLLPASPERAG